MNGETLKDFTTELLAGRELGDTLFYQLLNNAKNRRERRRAWMKLRTVDSSNSVTSSTTFATEFTMPTNFIRFYGKYPIRLVRGTDVVKLEEIPLEQLDEQQNACGYFAVNHSTNKFYITGTWSQSYTVKIYHTAKSTAIAAGTEWVFGDDFALALCFDVAAQQKGDISYDDINARMVQYHGKSISDIDSAMILWDANLQVNSRGV